MVRLKLRLRQKNKHNSLINIMTNFSNKTVLVTGASGGIGRAIAQQFAEAGTSVVVHFNNNERAAKRTLESLKGDSHRLVRADLTDPEELPNLVETVTKGMGKIDVGTRAPSQRQNAFQLNKTTRPNPFLPLKKSYCMPEK